MTYVELHCHSAYSFLDGASQPEELAARAAELGYEALALTDHDGVCGSLEFAHAAKALGVKTVVTGDVHAHRHERAILQDALVAIRNCTALEGCEPERRGNWECVLLPPAEVHDRFPDDRAAVARTRELAERLEFDL